MTSHQLAELEFKLASAGVNDLAAVALDGLVIALPQAGGAPVIDHDLAVSFDKALTLIGQILPSWRVELQGATDVDGNWTCMLRESGLRDDLEVIGIGGAATAPLAMIVALLRVLISRSKGYK